MGLFGKKKRELPPLISDEELFPIVDYDSVLEWLVGLSEKDFVKVGEVATIHRKALEESAKILGKPNEPTTFIDDPKYKLQTVPPILIDKEPAFLEDDAESSASRQQRKTAKKATKGED